MKNLKTFVICIIVIFFVLPTDSFAQSQSTVNQEQPFQVFIPCANGGEGELVTGTINLHIVAHTNKDGLLTKIHFQPQKSDLTGVVTGDSYNANGVTQEKFNNPMGAGTYTMVNNFHIVGPVVEYMVKQTVHVTMNANGEITTFVDNFDGYCMESED